MASLPRDRVTLDGWMPSCPWCDGNMGAAQVSLEALFDAHHHRELTYAHRTDGGRASPCVLTVDCPTCARPSMVALQEDGMRLLAIRTDADVQLLGAA